jgi:hypothetical protein
MEITIPEKISKFISNYIYKTFKPSTIIDGLCGAGSASI